MSDPSRYKASPWAGVTVVEKTAVPKYKPSPFAPRPIAVEERPKVKPSGVIIYKGRKTEQEERPTKIIEAEFVPTRPPVHLKPTPNQVKTFLPEAPMVLRQWAHPPEKNGPKPRKFMDAIEIVVTPAAFDPSGLGDFDTAHLFSWDGKTLSKGPGWTYGSMLALGGRPGPRTVTVPKGQRVWYTRYSGQWGGYWVSVHVYINPDDMPKYLPGRI